MTVYEINNNSDVSKKNSKKNSKKKASKTLVKFILDETGSMDSVRQATIDGFNEYVNGLKGDKKNKYELSLVKFDSNGIKQVYDYSPISDVQNLTFESYRPGAMTNLNDAIGFTITEMEEKIKSKNVNVLVVIMTDGHENASIEWRDPTRIRDLISQKEKNGWTITFLGANMDAQKVAGTYAIRVGNAKSFSVQNMGATMRGLAGTTRNYASSATLGQASSDFYAGTGDWTVNENLTDNSTITGMTANMPGTTSSDKDFSKTFKSSKVGGSK